MNFVSCAQLELNVYKTVQDIESIYKCKLNIRTILLQLIITTLNFKQALREKTHWISVIGT